MSNVMNPDGTHKVIAGYSHTLGLQERDQRIAELEAEVARLKDDIRQLEYERAKAGKRILEMERES